MKAGIHPDQLRVYVVRPVLEELGLHSRAAENLVLGTAAQESKMGHYVHQLGGGPALGIFQMEPFTHDDIWENYLDHIAPLADKVLAAGRVQSADSEQLVGNLRYAAAMCRIHYWRIPAGLPGADDVPALAAYWKRYYNTELGRGTPAEFIANYRKFLQ